MCERKELDGFRRLIFCVTLEESPNPVNFKFTHTTFELFQMNSINAFHLRVQNSF